MSERWRYDGMVTQTADGSLRFRVYEPRWWQLGRHLYWLWVRFVRSRFSTSIATVETTLQLEHGRIVVRGMAEPAPSRRRH